MDRAANENKPPPAAGAGPAPEEELKVKGNASFKAGNYAKAVEHYGRGVVENKHSTDVKSPPSPPPSYLPPPLHPRLPPPPPSSPPRRDCMSIPHVDRARISVEWFLMTLLNGEALAQGELAQAEPKWKAVVLSNRAMAHLKLAQGGY